MMAERLKIALLAVLLGVGLLLAGFAAGWKLRGEHTPPPVADTVTIRHTDTVTLVGPRDTLIRIAWKPYPVAVHDTTWIIRHTTDSIWVTLPYQHRHLSKPDTLDVWYSGVNPRIDSARVYMHHTTEIVRQPYEVARMPRLSLNVGVGAFYHDKQVFPYLFGEIPLNSPKLPNTEIKAYGAIDHQGRWAAGASVSCRLGIAK